MALPVNACPDVQPPARRLAKPARTPPRRTNTNLAGAGKEAPFSKRSATRPDAKAELEARVSRRLREGGDASEATLEVLQAQLRSREALTGAERGHAMARARLDSDAERDALGRARPGTA